MRRTCLSLMILAMTLVFAPAASAQNFPDKPIQLVVPWNPGGGSDITARILADNVKDYLSQPMIVSNITGASGQNAVNAVFDAKPDGHTLLWEHPTNLTVTPMLTNSKARWTDFEYICAIGHSDLVLIAKKSSPWTNAKEAFDYIKANPKKVRWSSGLKSAPHLLILNISEVVGNLDVVLMPVQGDKNRVVSIMAEKSDITTVSWASAEPYIKSGDMKALAIFSDKRSTFAPDVPTLKEQGYDVRMIYMYTLEAPKGTPESVKKILADAFEKAMGKEETQKALLAQSVEPYFLNAEDTLKIWKENAELYEGLSRKYELIK